MGWLYVPELAASSLDCTFCTVTPTKLDVMWKGKPIQPRVLSRECKKDSFIKLLCGPTLEPSMATRGVAKYISSLVDIRASHLASQENKGWKKTSVTSGQKYLESLRKLKLPSSSLKTLLTTSNSALLKYAKAYEKWATSLKQAYSARKKWAQLIGGKGFSSWPTPTANSMTGSGTQGRQGGVNLQTKVSLWATPIARDWKDGANLSLKVPTNSMLGRQAPRSGVSGIGASDNGCHQLNPIFVEWLMGFPTRWSLPDTEPTSFEHSAMQLYHWLQHMRSMLYLMIKGNR